MNLEWKRYWDDQVFSFSSYIFYGCSVRCDSVFFKYFVTILQIKPFLIWSIDSSFLARHICNFFFTINSNDVASCKFNSWLQIQRNSHVQVFCNASRHTVIYIQQINYWTRKRKKKQISFYVPSFTIFSTPYSHTARRGDYAACLFCYYYCFLSKHDRDYRIQVRWTSARLMTDFVLRLVFF